MRGTKRDFEELGRDLQKLKEEPPKMPPEERERPPALNSFAALSQATNKHPRTSQARLATGGWCGTEAGGHIGLNLSACRPLSGLGPAVYFGCELDLSSATSRTEIGRCAAAVALDREQP